jgi:uncharacterized protein YndB with AHSA1/START domain
MKVIHHVLDVDASAATVWRAITDEQGLASWWSTKVRTPAAAIGADIEFTFAGDFIPVMRITKLDTGKELSWLCQRGHEPWKDNSFRFELASLDDGRTRLRFWQDYATELSDDAYGVYNFNWGYYLESLRRYCTTGVGQPFTPE